MFDLPSLRLDDCNEELHARGRVPVVSGEPARPHVTAGPRVNDTLVGARSTHGDKTTLIDALHALRPPYGPHYWAVEQALSWL